MPSTKRGSGGGVGSVKVGRGTGVIEMSGPVPVIVVEVPVIVVEVPVIVVEVPVIVVEVPVIVVEVPVIVVEVSVVIGNNPWRKGNDTALAIVPPPCDATQKLLNKLKVRCSNDGAERSGQCRNRIQHSQIESWETVICHIRVEAENVLVKSIVQVHEESSRFARTLLILQHCIYCLSVVKFRFKQNDFLLADVVAARPDIPDDKTGELESSS
jgi:hypothetical protein